MRIPSNLQVFASHGAYSAPSSIERFISPDFDKRLRRNFSDFATAELLQGIPDEQKVIPRHGRIAKDPNRAEDAPDSVRTEDFNGISIFHSVLPIDLLNTLAQESYGPYHKQVLDRLLGQHGDIRDTLIAIDLHDTGNLLLGRTQDHDRPRLETSWQMPNAIISNQEGVTASQQIMGALRDALCRNFGFAKSEVQVNDPYKGGFVTTHYGNPDNTNLSEAAHQERAVIQLELGRFLYLDEATQEPLSEAIEHFGSRLQITLSEVADGFRHST